MDGLHKEYAVPVHRFFAAYSKMGIDGMQGLDDYKLDPPDTVDFADVVRDILYQSEDEIDQVLELLDDLDREYREVGADEFRYALMQVIELIQRWYPHFKRSDRLADYRKELAAQRNMDLPQSAEKSIAAYDEAGYLAGHLCEQPDVDCIESTPLM